MEMTRRKSIRDYSEYYRLRTTLLLLVSPVLSLLAMLIAWLSTLAMDGDVKWLVILIAAGSGGIIGALIVLPFILRPMRSILTAVSYKTGELTAQKLTNPNSKKCAKSGLKAVLEGIYSQEAVSLSKEPVDAPRVDAMLDTSSCGVVVMDNEHKIIYANASAPIITRPDGRPELALEFVDDLPLENWLQDVADHKISAERQWSRVPTLPEFSKKHKIYDVAASYKKGAPGETVIILFDRSSRYLPEEEDLNFIAFAAHELRGPITVIRGYIDILRQELDGRLKGDETQLLERLEVSASRLSGYINNILNVAKFDRHHLKVHLVEDTVVNIYNSIADDMQLRASTQHRILNIDIPTDLPKVAADRGSISEVVANLIDNAIKYSFEGGVVSVKAEKKGDFVEVSVADNGVGMPPAVLKNLFHKFYRSHRSREAVAGTGIGLYICRAFVESHGGHITARSQENQGSVFSFTLPIYSTVQDKLLEDGQMNSQLIRTGGGWIKNHNMYRN